MATTSSYSQIKTRTAYLRGESTTDTVQNSHIQAAIRDILNTYPFSWNVKSTTLTLAAGVAALPADYNPVWHAKDARIVTGASLNDDFIFTEIEINDRDQYSTSDYVYWITYNTTTNLYTLNTLTQTGSVVFYYYFWPADISSDADVCIIPDWEAISYLAASKMWVGDERNLELKKDYQQEAQDRIEKMHNNDINYQPKIKASFNSLINRK